MDLKVQMLTVNCFPSTVISAGVEISYKEEDIVIFVFGQCQVCSRKHKGELKAKKGEEGRQEKTLKRSRKVGENFAGQAEGKKKIVRDSVTWWAGVSCGRVSKQLPFPSSCPPQKSFDSPGECCGLGFIACFVFIRVMQCMCFGHVSKSPLSIVVVVYFSSAAVNPLTVPSQLYVHPK